jgi:hypothetical protein
MRDTAKPHITLRTIIIMSNELTQRTESGAVPSWMRAASKGASLGNIDASDLKPPRLKILAGQSPEVTDGKPNAVPGNFWMTILEQNLGPQVTGAPILLRKSYQLWAPRGSGVEQKGPLATASDGIHWDTPNQTFEVRFPGNPTVYKWHIKKTVTENAMHKFGSSQPDNPKSKPAATLTYDMLWLIDLPKGSKQLCVFTSARTGVTPTQNFVSTMMAMGIDHYYQRYRIVAQRRTGPTGDPYFSFEFQHIGNVQDEKEGEALRALYDQYSRSGFVTDFGEEADEIRGTKSAGKTEFSEDDREEIPF